MGRESDGFQTDQGVRLIAGASEHWKIHCEQASREQDSAKLLELIRAVNDLLETKRNKIKSRGLQFNT